MHDPTAGSASGAANGQPPGDDRVTAARDEMDRWFAWGRAWGLDGWQIMEAWYRANPLSPAEEASADRFLAHWRPLAHCKIHGIPVGLQWGGLGELAWEYARDLSTSELAGELWAVVEASEQDMRRPWKRRQIENIAERAVKNREAADIRWQEQMRAALAAWRAWPGSAAAWPRPKRRPERRPGTRQRRKPGRAAA
jgi:hypothetical protein